MRSPALAWCGPVFAFIQRRELAHGSPSSHLLQCNDRQGTRKGPRRTCTRAIRWFSHWSSHQADTGQLREQPKRYMVSWFGPWRDSINNLSGNSQIGWCQRHRCKPMRFDWLSILVRVIADPHIGPTFRPLPTSQSPFVSLGRLGFGSRCSRHRQQRPREVSTRPRSQVSWARTREFSMLLS